jgi:hypothetical protein
MRNGWKLSRLFLLMVLLVGLFAHGRVIAQQESALHSASQIADAMPHQLTASACDEGQCPGVAHMDSCCFLGHCPLGVLVEPAAPLPGFAPASPVAGAAVAAQAEPQDNPERPPQRT